MPAWIGPDGMPLSWRFYVYGRAHLNRADGRETLRAASAGRLAAADDRSYRNARREIKLFSD